MAERDANPESTNESDVDSSHVLERLLRERWSCRAFEDRAVPDATIERLLQLAQRSASWSNLQPWQVIVTRGAGTERFRAAMRAHAESEGARTDSDFPRPKSYEGVYQERRRECGWQLYEAVEVTRGDRAASAREALRNFDLFDAPHAAIITTAASQGVYGAVDCGLYVGTFLLAAQSLGLGAVAQAALARWGPFVRDYFSLPEDRLVLVGISFGYPDLAHPVNGYRTSRADLDTVVQWCDS
jgi:nitroreductase